MALIAACTDCGVDAEACRAMFPRGAVELAAAYHKAGDALMLAALKAHDLAEMRIRDRIALMVRLRLEAADKELVRRGSALFSLPQYAGDGAGLIWDTADAMWTALGDTSEDGNWYSKRATLSAVYGSTVLFWLGDTSDGDTDTWAFLDRRIENVMQFEKLKAQARKVPVIGTLFESAMAGLKAPRREPMTDVPGVWKDK